jgi:cytochrome c peroxidase
LAAQIKQVVKIKVPLGLDDPSTFTPAANRPTLGKWELGKQLFFDKDIFLQPAMAATKTSCATCHDPAKGFSDGKVPIRFGDFATPRLLNAAYHSYQFWDGRADALEEVAQRTLDEGPGSDGPTMRHAWTGIVQRLRDDPHYDFRFRKVFGTPPTQDAVGKALATYLRTVLSGNSLQDRAERAMRQRGGKILGPGDYETVLDASTLKALQLDEGVTKADAVKQLHEGYTLFHGKANCIACHSGSTYTDNSFHNLGVGDSARPPLAGKENGRFAVLPVGLKDRRMIGAYKTPSLRSLPRTGPFFHDGLRVGPDALFDVVSYHVKGGTANAWLDTAMRPLDLKESEVRALVLFLKALEGEPPAAVVTTPPEPFEKMPAPKK